MTTKIEIHCDAPGCDKTATPGAPNWLEVGWLNGSDTRKWHACSWQHLALIGPNGR